VPAIYLALARQLHSNNIRFQPTRYARLLGMELGVVIVKVGRHSLSAADAIAVVRQANLVLLVKCKSLLDKV
jgi:hypothetical protein